MSAIDPPDPPSSSNDRLAEPKRMLSLLSVVPTQSGWMPSELGAILTHQLDIPLHEVVAGTLDAGVPTLRHLLTNPSPPAALMQQLKGLFKTASTATDDLLPKEVATILYLAIIVAGERTGLRLTSLDPAALHERLDWASKRRWLDPMLGDLFRQHIEKQSR